MPSIIHFTSIAQSNTNRHLCLVMFYWKDTLLHNARYFFALDHCEIYPTSMRRI